MSYLTSLFLDTSDPGLFLYGSHNPWLVALSLLIAIFASCMALQVAGMARLSDNPLYRQVALVTGSLALGGGVWSMHFIGMLAFQLCARVDYAPGLTLLSLLPSLFASWIALQLLARRSISSVQLISSGVLVGAGIGAMHYSGMAAMQMAPLLRYDPYWFALSILVAVVLAILALWVRFGLRGRISGGRAILASGVVMGLAIAGMHYTGMAAARFIGNVEPLDQQSNADSVFIALAVALITVTLTVFVAATNGLLRYRQLYRQMQGSESRLRAILETAVDGIVLIDEHGVIEGLNTAAERLYGWRKEELVGRHINIVIPASYHQGALDYLPKVMREGQSDIIGGSREVEAQLKDGSLLPIRLAIGNANLPGKTLYVGFISDISERKAMEQALRESEQQYRSLISNIPGVSFRCLLDEQWTMLFISDAVQGLTGWSVDDFISKRLSIASLYHPDDYQPVVEQVLAAIEQRRNYTVEYRLFGRDGKEHWIWESGSAVCDEQGIPRWIDGVLLDQTETKLRNAEYEGKVNAISKAMAMVEFDLQGHVLEINDNALDLFGYQRADVIGQHHRLFCDPLYADSDDYRQFWAALGKGMFSAGEYRRISRGGSEVWIQATYNPILDADGNPFKVVKLATDLTPRRLMEQETRAARDRAEAAAAARSSFLANMSHEIRTPMNAIIGYTELLLGTPLADEQRRHLQTVQQASRSLLGLLNDILDTAKLDRGAIELEDLDFSLRELCEQVCATQRLTAEAKGLALQLEYPAQLQEFYRGDALRLQQVLTNLLGNAVKFTAQGQVCLRVQGEPGAIRLTVEDSGIGIAADRLEKIFEPFAQADASMSRRFGGTGLGTTISRQLVELMDGRLRVESTLGEGSRFIVELPLRLGQRLAPQVRQALPELAALHVLAADDVPQNLELLQLNLQRLGHRVTCVADGLAAVEAFANHDFDLILMDVQMPVVDGLEASRRIRAFEAAHQCAAVPIIALTASVLDQDRQAALDAGMNGFASKPLDLAALLAEMARLLGVAQAEPAVEFAAADPAGLFDWQRGTRLWGGPVQMSGAIQRFLAEQGALVEQLGSLLEHHDWDSGRSLAHRFRGAAANLGLTHLASLGLAIEHAFNLREGVQLRSLLPALSRALTAVAEALPLVPESVAAKQTLDIEQLREALQRLQGAVSRGGLDDQALDSLTQGLHNTSQTTLLAQIRLALDDFDFDRAQHALSELLEQLQDEERQTP